VTQFCVVVAIRNIILTVLHVVERRPCLGNIVEASKDSLKILHTQLRFTVCGTRIRHFKSTWKIFYFQTFGVPTLHRWPGNSRTLNVSRGGQCHRPLRKMTWIRGLFNARRRTAIEVFCFTPCCSLTVRQRALINAAYFAADVELWSIRTSFWHVDWRHKYVLSDQWDRRLFVWILNQHRLHSPQICILAKESNYQSV